MLNRVVDAKAEAASGNSGLAAVVRWLLLTPLAMSAKRHLREAWWTWKGRGIEKPSLPSDVQSIIFVCLGNICRSPFAEVVARDRCERGGEVLRIGSAGIRAVASERSPAHARDVARERFRLSLDDHTPRMLTRELIDDYDLVIVMEQEQQDLLRRNYSDRASRIVLLPLYDDGKTGFERLHIADPFQQPRQAFEVCFDRIERTVSRLLSDIQGARERAES